ncbi:MAG TPA: hypothetical protein VGE74_05485 [Gemmata sp.]
MSQRNRRDVLKVAAAAGLGAVGPSAGRTADEGKPPIVRLTVLDGRAYAPSAEGNWTKEGDELKWSDYVSTVRKRAAGLEGRPVVIMVHGFMADPREEIKKPQTGNNPHTFSFHFATEEQLHWRHTAGWPRGLGLAPAPGAGGKPGLPIGFGWNSMPDLFTQPKNEIIKTLGSAFLGLAFNRQAREDLGRLTKAVTEAGTIVAQLDGPLNAAARQNLLNQLDALLTGVEDPLARTVDRMPAVYSEPYKRAERAGEVLARAIQATSTALPDTPVDLFCHSLGSRVVLQSLRKIAEWEKQGVAEFKGVLRRVGRVILVGGAEYAVHAQGVLDALRDAGAKDGPLFYNFMARRDRVLDILAQKCRPVDKNLTRTIGLVGLDTAQKDKRWIDLQIDKVDGAHPLNRWLKDKRNGMAVAGADRFGVLNHWYYFTDKGNMDVFRAILHDRPTWDVTKLREEQIPERAGIEKVGGSDTPDRL